MATLNSDCQLPTEPINVKLPPVVTPAKLEFFGEAPSIFLLRLSEAPNRKNQNVRDSAFKVTRIIEQLDRLDRRW